MSEQSCGLMVNRASFLSWLKRQPHKRNSSVYTRGKLCFEVGELKKEYKVYPFKTQTGAQYNTVLHTLLHTVTQCCPRPLLGRTEAGLPGSCQLKRPNFVFKKAKFWILLNKLLEKKGQTLNKPRLEKKAKYLINFEANCLKKGQICHIWPRKGQPGNPGCCRVARSLQVKKAKLCFKKGQILDFTK